MNLANLGETKPFVKSVFDIASISFLAVCPMIMSTILKESLKHVEVAQDIKVILRHFDLGCPVTLVHVEPAARLSHSSEVVLSYTFLRSLSVRQC
jgi:hypothetical protein